MSSRGLGVLALAMVVPLTARAQDVATLERRLTQLEALRHNPQAAAVRAESTSRESFDTIGAGSLRVVARLADAELVRRAAGIAWARLDTLYGTAAAAVDVAFQLGRAASAQLAAHADTALTNWLGPQLLNDVPLGTMESRTYVELVTAPSVAVHHCFAGDLDACRTALGLLGPGVDRITAWYDAAERRGLVRHPLWSSPPTGSGPAMDACLLSGSDSACLDMLHRLTVEPPLSNEARQSLARIALRSDPTAFGRLAASAGQPLASRLADAARQPSDSLISRWRVEIIAARPRPVTFAAGLGWTALGWMLVFGLLSLRSTRWR